MAIRENLKWWLFPGINLHARLRYRILPQHFGSSTNGVDRLVLDAGCGNGMLSYRSFEKGNKVIGLSLKDREVAGNQKLFHECLGLPKDRLEFRKLNLHQVGSLNMKFDEIICTEVLEHIKDDVGVCRQLFDCLKPGGVVHITSPNAEHPYNVKFPLDPDEKGGHVRQGYTMASYKALLEPLGFVCDSFVGLGGPVRQAFNSRIKEIQKPLGFAAGFGLFFVAWPFLFLDPPTPKIPFSLYVRATKPDSSSSN